MMSILGKIKEVFLCLDISLNQQVVSEAITA